MQITGSLGDETAEKPNENNERAQFSTQRKSLPHPRSALGRESGSLGCWAHWEAGNTAALCSRSTELLAETRLQAERGEEVLWPHSHPTHQPPASASHWVNLTGGQMSQEPCTRSLQGWAPRLQRRGKAQSRQQGLQAWASIGTIISMYT